MDYGATRGTDVTPARTCCIARLIQFEHWPESMMHWGLREGLPPHTKNVEENLLGIGGLSLEGSFRGTCRVEAYSLLFGGNPRE